jgi:hypothetical protein
MASKLEAAANHLEIAASRFGFEIFRQGIRFGCPSYWKALQSYLASSSLFPFAKHLDDLRILPRVKCRIFDFVRREPWKDGTDLLIRPAFQKMPSRPPCFHDDRLLVLRLVGVLVPAILDRLQNDIAG